MQTEAAPILQMKSITKSFPGTLALDHVDFQSYPGEVHVLMGENGAGKSTLMKILSGACPMDHGEVWLEGHVLSFKNTEDARRYGISIVHQELNLLPNRSVFQNVFLGKEPTKKFGCVNQHDMVEKTVKIFQELDMPMDPFLKVRELGIAKQQMVEIARTLLEKAKVIILDEPTSSLSNAEIRRLFQIILKLKASGVSIIYISHRMEEILEIGDRITILRDGQKVGSKKIADCTMEEIIVMMVGRKINQLYRRDYQKPKDIVLRTDQLTGHGFNNCSIYLKRGEIVSISGLVGSGRTEFAKALFGVNKVTGGDLYLFGKKVKKHTLDDSLKHHIGFLPENRKEEGLIGEMTVTNNVVMASLQKLFPLGILNKTKERESAALYTKQWNLSGRNGEKKVFVLSGGNQQKVVVAKWLCSECDIFIFDEPTRGIDVGAKAELYEIMDQLVAEGAAILMISSELREVIGISDRTYVMREGTIAGELLKHDLTQEKILALSIQKAGDANDETK